MTRIAALVALWLLFVGAAPTLVPDVSSRRVEIQTSFTGEELLLFGAIIYPGDMPAGGADVAVVLRGPADSILVREKQKVAGVWVNADSQLFRSAPGFYAVASSAPLGRLVDERTAAIYELGLANLQLSPGAGQDPAGERRIEQGFIERMKEAQLYAEYPDGIEVTDGVLYRARIAIPSRVPVGDYTAETFLIADGRVLAVATRDVAIGKTGFERFVALAAERRQWEYGLAAVAISLFLGWFAAFVFARRS
ncbi:TIGR02186 family protein [Sphingomicrobium sp. XHP0235]|uniref:TIGR02186 family protein n=1 Tax=Sphingomicrobium aquimarinum TaxID=3133971 RepID=UPI0031FE6653